jgi:4-hydroxy-tetrahydrodipicolinate reductase
MKIALVGTGQTGSIVDAMALERGHMVVARFNSRRPLAEATPEEWAEMDVAIDFSLPSLALDHIALYCTRGVPAVIGTTGWHHERARVEALVHEHGASLLLAANFSVGVALLVRALQSVAPLLNRLPEYDAYIHEIHHRRKVDSPSGTALLLAETLKNALTGKTSLATETQHGRIAPEALHVSSTRAGHVVGHHTVGFDSPFDSLRFTHDAKNRLGFAHGALLAAEWLPGKRGLFSLDDVLHLP